MFKAFQLHCEREYTKNLAIIMMLWIIKSLKWVNNRFLPTWKHRYPGLPFCLVLDNAPYHMGGMIIPFVMNKIECVKYLRHAGLRRVYVCRDDDMAYIVLTSPAEDVILLDENMRERITSSNSKKLSETEIKELQTPKENTVYLMRVVCISIVHGLEKVLYILT